MLICFGSNEFGQCANETTGSLISKFDFNPVKLNGNQAQSVACGAAHTLVLTRSETTGSKKLLAFGLNDKKQLGLSDKELDKVKTSLLIRERFSKTKKTSLQVKDPTE
jgi:alpha-tubulin suppressor-like RCC1 family protein